MSDGKRRCLRTRVTLTARWFARRAVIPYFIYFPRVWKLEAKIRRARQRSAGNVDAASSDEVRAASSKAKRLRNKFKNAVTILMFLLHNKVSKILFGVFDVYQKPIGDKYYIRGDLELEAFSINHSLGLVTACVGIAGYTLGKPAPLAHSAVLRALTRPRPPQACRSGSRGC